MEDFSKQITNMTKLADDFGTDKGSKKHNYTKYYAPIFQEIRDKPVKILEFGVAEGGSMRLWYEWFSDPKLILGIDKNKNCNENLPNILDVDHGGIMKVINGMQADPKILAKIIKMKPFNIIIDDGSHRAEDQQHCFTKLFPTALANGGIYVIEDLHTPRTTKIRRTLDVIKEMMDTGYYNGDFYTKHSTTKNKLKDLLSYNTIRKCKLFDNKIAFIYKKDE